MDDVRLVDAFLDLKFDRLSKDKMNFMREFEILSKDSVDPINEWVRHQKANGNADETDKILLNLIIELHKKVDFLIQKVEGKEEEKYLDLSESSDIISIGYEYFKIKDQNFNENEIYYGRISLPVFPKRVVPLVFVAKTKDIANITKISFSDEKDWDTYVSIREREIIREMKGTL